MKTNKIFIYVSLLGVALLMPVLVWAKPALPGSVQMVAPKALSAYYPGQEVEIKAKVKGFMDKDQIIFMICASDQKPINGIKMLSEKTADDVYTTKWRIPDNFLEERAASNTSEFVIKTSYVQLHLASSAGIPTIDNFLKIKIKSKYDPVDQKGGKGVVSPSKVKLKIHQDYWSDLPLAAIKGQQELINFMIEPTDPAATEISLQKMDIKFNIKGGGDYSLIKNLEIVNSLDGLQKVATLKGATADWQTISGEIHSANNPTNYKKNTKMFVQVFGVVEKAFPKKTEITVSVKLEDGYIVELPGQKPIPVSQIKWDLPQKKSALEQRVVQY